MVPDFFVLTFCAGARAEDFYTRYRVFLPATATGTIYPIHTIDLWLYQTANAIAYTLRYSPIYHADTLLRFVIYTPVSFAVWTEGDKHAGPDEHPFNATLIFRRFATHLLPFIRRLVEHTLRDPISLRVCVYRYLLPARTFITTLLHPGSDTVVAVLCVVDSPLDQSHYSLLYFACLTAFVTLLTLPV